jgi:hypothetical protein
MRKFNRFCLAFPAAELATAGPVSTLSGQWIKADVLLADQTARSVEAVEAATAAKSVPFVLNRRLQLHAAV